jgi:serine/threonine protein kinase
MALSVGTRLGPYEILSAIGAGGMGEVYRARDTRLDRDVAVKVLGPQFAADAEVRERFEREAKTISALDHPHICTLYDVGVAPNPQGGAAGAESVQFLLIQYLEGETLADRLARWIAYDSNDSGAIQVYVEPFPTTGVKIRLSAESGMSPAWSMDGKTIFYSTAEQRSWP